MRINIDSFDKKSNGFVIKSKEQNCFGLTGKLYLRARSVGFVKFVFARFYHDIGFCQMKEMLLFKIRVDSFKIFETTNWLVFYSPGHEQIYFTIACKFTWLRTDCCFPIFSILLFSPIINLIV